MKTIEYRVRPVTRYIVTAFHEAPSGAGSECCGEFDNEIRAHNAAMAFAEQATHAAQPADKVSFDKRNWTPEDGWDDCPREAEKKDT